jgi:hypothetical protein
MAVMWLQMSSRERARNNEIHYILMAPQPTWSMSAEVDRSWPRGSPGSHQNVVIPSEGLGTKHF